MGVTRTAFGSTSGSTASTPERSIEELFEHYRIASSPGALSIPQESISDEDLAAILGDPRTPELRSLELSGNQLTSTGLGHILSSPKTQALTFLNLAHNHLDDESIQALASSSRMTSIEHLLLAGNRIGPIGTTYLTKSPHLQNLRVLSLGNQGIEDGGAIALAEHDSLETLDLSQAQITASGASKLLEKSKAETLILSGNPLNRGTLNLERFSGELTELELRDCSIGAEELDALQSVDHGGSIRTINLNNNPTHSWT